MRLRRAAILTAVFGGTLLALGCSGESPLAPTAQAATSLPQRLPASTGKTFYVSTRGNNSNPGTRARPWRTIQYAVRRLRPGQRAVVRAGTYTENVHVDRAGTPSAPKTIAAFSGERPIIQSGTYPLQISGAYFRIAGFILQGAGRELTNVYFEDGADHIELLRNNIRSSRDQGIFSEASTNNLHLIANRIHDNGDGSRDNGQSNGIYLEGRNHFVVNNVIYNHPHGFGIQVYPQNTGSIIVNNTVVRSGHSGIVVGGSGGVGNIQIRNNILAFNDNYGVQMDSTCPTATVGIVRNVIYGNGEGRVEGGCSRVNSSGNINAAPRFVSLAKRNLALRSGSPAIDRARADWAPRTDVLGRRRPQGPGYDIGAYERP